MNRGPNVVTKGLGERMVKPATEIFWAGFFVCGRGKRIGGNHVFIEKTLSGGRWSGLDGVHISDRSRSPGILDRRSRYPSWTEFGPSLGEGSRLCYVTVFLHCLIRRSRA